MGCTYVAYIQHYLHNRVVNSMVAPNLILQYISTPHLNRTFHPQISRLDKWHDAYCKVQTCVNTLAGWRKVDGKWPMLQKKTQKQNPIPISQRHSVCHLAIAVAPFIPRLCNSFSTPARAVIWTLCAGITAIWNALLALWEFKLLDR